MLPYNPKLEARKRFFETLISNTIILYFIGHVLACCWIRAQAQFDNRTDSVFIDGIYFVMATASTIGYGDISVDKKIADEHISMYLFATAAILLALIYFAYMQSLIWSMAVDWTKIEGDMNQSLEEFEDWMAVRNQTQGSTVTLVFESACKSYIKYMSNRDVLSKVNSGGYMEAMSYFNQNKIKKYVTKNLIDTFSFFKLINRYTAADLCMKYSALKYVCLT